MKHQDDELCVDLSLERIARVEIAAAEALKRAKESAALFSRDIVTPLHIPEHVEPQIDIERDYYPDQSDSI